MAHVNTQEKLLAFRRVWDREIRQELDQHFVLATVTTLSTIIGNVVEHPDEEKYRKLPATNKRLVETVLDRKGGKSYLLCSGFVKKTIDDKDFWVLNVGPQTIDILKIGLELINEKKEQIATSVENEKKREEIEKEKNAKRADLAKQQFEEDRHTWQERLAMTGGTKESVAQPFRDRDAETNAAPPPGAGPVRAMPMPMPPGADDTNNPPPGGNVLGE